MPAVDYATAVSVAAPNPRCCYPIALLPTLQTILISSTNWRSCLVLSLYGSAETTRLCDAGGDAAEVNNMTATDCRLTLSLIGCHPGF